MSDLGNLGIPPPQLPFGTGKDSKGATISVLISDVWHKFLVRLSQLSAERALLPVTPGASPWSYTATTIGNLAVIGGTVSSRVLTRGGDSVTLTGTIIPMAAGDVATITYTVAPTVTFIPEARA